MPAPTDKEYIDRFIKWASTGAVGCVFAQTMVKHYESAGWEFSVIKGDTFDTKFVSWLNGHLESRITKSEAVQILFPDIKTSEQIAGLLRFICSNENLGCSELRDAKIDVPGVIHVALRWRLPKTNFTSWVLGFADLDSMPATRRAPFVSIALRPNAPGTAPSVARNIPNENVSRTRESDGRMPVHLADMEPGLPNEEAVKKMWVATEKLKASKLRGDSNAPGARAKITFSFNDKFRGLLPLY